MKNKYFKFHFKNDKESKIDSYNVDLNNFTEAMEFAYDKLDELNNNTNGYRIVGIYEILTLRKSHVSKPKTNYKRSK
jgi:hypothetical protein